MKKKILSFLLMICILSSVFAAFPVVANATGNLPVSINAAYCYYDNEGNVKASVRFDSANKAGTAIFGVYDEGKFINIGQKAFDKDQKAKMVKIEGVDESYIGYEARIFCWGGDNFLIPISLPVTVQITDFATEMVRRLNAVSDEIDIYTDRVNHPDTFRVFTNQEKAILSEINECIDDAVAYHAEELTADFIKNNYEGSVEEKTGIKYVKSIYEDLEAKGLDGAFRGNLASYFTVDNLIWLADTLGLDVAQFGIDKEDYI